MNDLPTCSCSGKFERVICAPAVHGDEIKSYVSPATGKFISSRQEAMADLKASGCNLYEAGMDKDIDRNRERAKEKSFAPIAKAVDETVTQLVNSGHIES